MSLTVTINNGTVEVAEYMMQTGYINPVDLVNYPGLGFLFVDKFVWEVGFSLWQQAAMSDAAWKIHNIGMYTCQMPYSRRDYS